MCVWKFSNLDDILHRRYVTIFSTYVKRIGETLEPIHFYSVPKTRRVIHIHEI